MRAEPSIAKPATGLGTEKTSRDLAGLAGAPTAHGPPAAVLDTAPGHVIHRARRYLAATPLPEIGAGSDSATLSAACGWSADSSCRSRMPRRCCGSGQAVVPAGPASGSQKVQHAARYGTEPLGALR